MNSNKRGVISDYLPWVLIALAVLAILVLSALLMKDKGFAFIDKIKDIFAGR